MLFSVYLSHSLKSILKYDTEVTMLQQRKMYYNIYNILLELHC